MSCFYFKLITPTETREIAEPARWSDIEVTLMRDADWHGLNYEFAGDDVSLEFDCAAGMDLINDVYDQYGPDGEIVFEFGTDDGEVEFTGRLNLNTLKRFKYRVSCTVERLSHHELVKSRWDAKVNVLSNKTFSGDGITPLPYRSIALKSKNITQRGTWKNATAVETPKMLIAPDDNQGWLWVLPDTAEKESEIEEARGYAASGLANDPPSSKFYILNVRDAGRYTVNIKLSYRFACFITERTISVGKIRFDSWGLSNYLIIQDNTGQTKEIHELSKTDGSGGEGRSSTSTGWIDVDVNQSIEINVEAGDEVYIYGEFKFEHNKNELKKTEVKISTRETNITIEGTSVAPDTTTKGYLIHDIADYAVKSITDHKLKLYSEFIGGTAHGYPQDGCGALNMLLNGYMLREFDVENRPLRLSFRDLMQSLSALYCLGFSYEKDANGDDILKIDRAENYYRDELIIHLPICFEYEANTAEDQIYAGVKVGYKKYPEEGSGVLEEFNTHHEYQTPVKTTFGQKEIVSDFVGSGYLIETTRREQFAEKPKDSTRYDDDTFVVAVTKLGYQSRASFVHSSISGDDRIEFSDVVGISTGDVFEISGTLFNDRTYQAVTVTTAYPSGNTIVYTDVSVVTESEKEVTVTGGYSSEGIQNYDVIAGLPNDSASAFNLRHSPKRMLYRWAKFLFTGLRYKSGSDVFRNTFVKHNIEIESLYTGSACKELEWPDSIKEQSDIFLAAFDPESRYFSPEWITFKSRVPYDDIKYIKNCLTGRNTEGKNYGYITTVNEQGEIVGGFVQEMRYNPNTEEVYFRLLKKIKVEGQIDPPFNCTDYSTWTFDQFEATPVPREIEQCLFQDFV